MQSNSSLAGVEVAQHPRLTAMRPGLALLLEAHHCAAESGRHSWEFGLELKILQAVGLGHNQLRWLLCQGWLQQAVEITPRRSPCRTFRPVVNLTLHPASCFILTADGINLLHHLAAAHGQPAPANNTAPPPNGYPLPIGTTDPASGGCQAPDPSPHQGTHVPRSPVIPATVPLTTLTPRWLSDRQELRLGDHLIKRFRRPAASQTTILAAFDEDGWPYRIDNPLSPTRACSDADRLQEAIRRLNHGQQTPLLRFHGDGSGEGVTWEIAR